MAIMSEDIPEAKRRKTKTVSKKKKKVKRTVKRRSKRKR